MNRVAIFARPYGARELGIPDGTGRWRFRLGSIDCGFRISDCGLSVPHPSRREDKTAVGKARRRDEWGTRTRVAMWSAPSSRCISGRFGKRWVGGFVRATSEWLGGLQEPSFGGVPPVLMAISCMT